MRLLSQSGEMSAEMDQVILSVASYPIYTEEDGYETMHESWAIYASNRNIGVYSTKEKAMNVMMEIHEKYADFERNNLVLKGMSDMILQNLGEEKYYEYLDFTKKSFVYQLPADKDVDIKVELKEEDNT